MANVEYVLKAKDEASATVSNVLRQFQVIDGVLGKIQSVGAGAGKFGLVAGGLIGIGSAAFVAATSLSNTVEQLDRLEENTGISSERLQAMRQIVEDNGGSFDEFETVFARLNRAIADGSPALKEMGITSRDTFTVFKQVAGALANISDPATRAKASYELLGKSSVKLLADMQALATQTDATRDAMERSGALIGGEAADAARELDSQVDALSRNWETALTRMKKVTVPVVSGIISAFNDMWDAVSGADRKPTLESLNRRLAEAQSRVRFLLAEANKHGGAAWNANATREAQKLMNDLQAERDKMLGIDTEAARMRSLHENRDVTAPLAGGGGSGGGKPGSISDAEIRRRMQWAAQGGPQNNSWEIAADANKKYFEGLAKSSEMVEEPMLRFTETAQRLREAMDMAERATAAWKFSTSLMTPIVASNIDQTISEVVRGSQNIRNIFSQLMTSIAQDLAEVGLKLGLGLGLDALGFLIGGPIGGFIQGVGQAVTPHAMAPAGGDTYNISTLNAKDLIQEIVSPSGQLRRANDRIRDVSLAAMG